MTRLTPEQWRRAHPGQRRCDVLQLPLPYDCRNVAVIWFTGVCEAGHKMQGTACERCKVSLRLCCGTCYQEDHHRVPVTITFEQLAQATA